MNKVITLLGFLLAALLLSPLVADAYIYSAGYAYNRPDYHPYPYYSSYGYYGYGYYPQPYYSTFYTGGYNYYTNTYGYYPYGNPYLRQYVVEQFFRTSPFAGPYY